MFCLISPSTGVGGGGRGGEGVSILQTTPGGIFAYLADIMHITAMQEAQHTAHSWLT
jgi:hypothetical protein